jgi:bacillithiol biosynthesis deacetylase BshB1
MTESDILIIAAHPDDAELHVGGTIIRTIDQGGRVAICDLTRGERGSRGSAELRAAETALANESLGVDAADRVNLGIPDGDIRITPENLSRLIAVIRTVRPAILLIPSDEDRHPDHGNASALAREAWFNAGLRAVKSEWEGVQQEEFRPARLITFDHAWESEPEFIIDISEQFDRKLSALAAYGSQFRMPTDQESDAERNKSNEPETFISTHDFMEYMIARMRRLGFQIGTRYGEGFRQIDSPIKVNDLRDLL